jgi:hypothetical protein
MKKIIYFTIIFIFTYCKSKEESNFEKLKIVSPNLEKLIVKIEKKHKDYFFNSDRNRIVFIKDKNEILNTKDFVLDSEIKSDMIKYSIDEIRFEKVEDSCSLNNSFTKVFFKIEDNSLDEISYYLYEYCGNSKEFHSKSIWYKPFKLKWGLYIER